MKIVTNNRPLAGIICGFEHSGTTLVSAILRQHPQLNSGFEGGFLLSDEASDFLTREPYYSHLKVGWRVNDEDLRYICAADTWAEVYQRLVERSPIFQNKNTLTFDKTPAYMAVLPEVLRRVPDVPCIVLVRDPRAVLWSRAKRKEIKTQWNLEYLIAECGDYLTYARGWKTAIEAGLGDRILLVQYEALCVNRCQEAERMLNFLGFDFQPSFLLFESEFENVHKKYVSNQYINEYQQGLPEQVSRQILEITCEFEGWFWDNQSEDKSTSFNLQQVQDDLERSRLWLSQITTRLKQLNDGINVT